MLHSKVLNVRLDINGMSIELHAPSFLLASILVLIKGDVELE